MNVLFIKHFFVGFMVSEIPRVSVFGHCPYSVTFPYLDTHLNIPNFIKCSRVHCTFMLYQLSW